ncbi:MAG: hypothetical protein A3H95_16015 [Acidobacteria bacterium RIFCSPLOWO2_02_FULL_64_15]|nr:MAG: hypothetical protein A3H95_16015 [Acidobacteria bacterium RIFCSPLOWO2_02_FULL_64_15]
MVKTVTVGRWRTNCYLVHDGATGIIIDPGDEPALLIERIDAQGFRPLAILNTHAHFDHVGGVYDVRERYKAPFHLHSYDKRLLSHANLYRVLAGDKTVYSTPLIDKHLDAVSPLQLGGWRIDVIATPGHTPGGVTFRVGHAVFSGDTLFADRLGRTDLPGGSQEQLDASLAALRAQPPECMLYPGHGPACELGAALAAIHSRAYK